MAGVGEGWMDVPCPSPPKETTDPMCPKSSLDRESGAHDPVDCPQPPFLGFYDA